MMFCATNHVAGVVVNSYACLRLLQSLGGNMAKPMTEFWLVSAQLFLSRLKSELFT